MKSWLQQIQASNTQAVDGLVIGGLVSMLAFNFCAVYAVLHGHPLDLQSYGVGIGGIILAVGTSTGLRDKLTPKGDPDADSGAAGR